MVSSSNIQDFLAIAATQILLNESLSLFLDTMSNVLNCRNLIKYLHGKIFKLVTIPEHCQSKANNDTKRKKYCSFTVNHEKHLEKFKGE